MRRRCRGGTDLVFAMVIFAIFGIVILGVVVGLKNIRARVVPCTHCVCVCGKDVCKEIPTEFVCADAMLRELAPWCNGREKLK